MKTFILITLLSAPSAWAINHTGAIGVETGVARLSDGSSSAFGQTWMAHFEYQVDPIVGFFGEAGRAQASNENNQFKQTTFNGGFLLDVLPFLELRLGIASTIMEIENKNSTKKENELGPMAGTAIYITQGIWKIGGTGTVIRTGSLQNTSLQFMLLMMF
jgi:hypothetical protein